MFLSARNIYSKNDLGWNKYLEFLKFPISDTIYTIDFCLNDLVSGSETIHLNRVDEIEKLKKQLPTITDQQYYQLAINISEEAQPKLPKNITILGYDISDETEISSLLNCGPWEKDLARIVKRLNQYGLLTLKDAKIAQELLPKVWGEDEPHAFVDIWCICKVS